MSTLTQQWSCSQTPLTGRRTMAAAVLAIGAGAFIAVSPGLALALALSPVMVWLVLRYPEPLIAMFLTAGLLKQDPIIGVLVPYDLTVVLAAAIVLAIVVKVSRDGMHFPKQGWLLLPLVAALALGVVGAANAYGTEKAVRFTTLTGLAIIAPLVLLDSRERLSRFLIAVAVIGIWVSVSAARVQETTHWGRVTSGGNPIPLGRAGALAFVFAWLRLHFARQPFERIAALAILGISAFSVMNSGSRGPVLSAVFALVVLSFVTQFLHRRAPIGLGTLIFIGVFGVIAISFVTVPEAVLRRFELLFNGEGGSSVLMRGFLYATAWQLMVRNPLGIGVGGFEPYAPLELRYPHNLFLEVGCELGWLPLVALLVILFLSSRALWQVLRNEYSWLTLFVALLLMTTLLNSMVSGDLNDNRPFFAALLLPFALLRIQNQQCEQAANSSSDVDRSASGLPEQHF